MLIGSVISGADPYVVNDTSTALGNRDTNAKTLSSQSLNIAIRNCILLIAGQSNVSNSFPTQYTPAHTGSVDNLNLYDGAIYAAADPLLGCSGPTPNFAGGSGNFAGRLADKLITANKFDRVILVPIGVDGTSVADWQTTYCTRILAALARLAYRGMTPTAILWGQGENDHGTSQAAYTASLTALISMTRTAGYAGPWFIAEQTCLSGAVDTNVQAAQLAIVNNAANIWAGPNADSLGSGDRQVDDIHFNDTGSDLYAGLWQTALAGFGPPF